MSKMFTTLVLLVLLLGAVVPASAQTETSALELYGGYDYVRFNVNARVVGFPPSSSHNGNGGGGQLEYNVNRWLGVVGDVSGYGIPTIGATAVAMSYLFGPRVNLHSGRLTPFAQTFFGGLLASNRIGTPGPENHFAMSAGGGLDVNVSHHMAVRPIQAEYFMTRYPDSLNNQQNNFRYSAGIVLQLGSK
jgi:opacity protein-like surface antigen